MMEKTQEMPKVSVCVVTYNQENYIMQCLQSIIDQKTDFKFEIVVSDDCSTDETGKIVRAFAEKYPLIVRNVSPTVNIGPFENYWRVHLQATGEFIAHMDGDDFALPNKLQAQSDLLTNNATMNIVWHAVDFISSNGKYIKTNKLAHSNIIFDRGDLINLMVIGTHSSKMYRSPRQNNKKLTGPILDIYMNIHHIGDGKATLIQEYPFGVHRLGIGISSLNYNTRYILLEILNRLLTEFPSHKVDVNSASFHLLMSDIKRRAPTFKNSLSLYLRTLSLSGVLRYFATYKMRRLLKFNA